MYLYNVWPGCQFLYLLCLYLWLGLLAHLPWMLLIGRMEWVLNGLFTVFPRTYSGVYSCPSKLGRVSAVLLGTPLYFHTSFAVPSLSWEGDGRSVFIFLFSVPPVYKRNFLEFLAWMDTTLPKFLSLIQIFPYSLFVYSPIYWILCTRNCTECLQMFC